MHREKNRCFLSGSVEVLVPGPERHDESVAFLPMKRLAVDQSCAAAAEGMINARAGVAVSFGVLIGAKRLNPAAQRRQGRTASDGVYIFQRDAIMGISAAAR